MKALLLGMLLIGLVSPGAAQPVRELTAEACVRIGLQNNRAVRAARYAEAEAIAGLEEARTLRLPVLSGQGSYQRLGGDIQDFEVAFPVPGSSGDGVFKVPALLNRYDLRLRVNQPLFTGGRLQQRIRAARYQAEAAQQYVEAAEADLAFQIREAYWALVEAQAVQDAIGTALAQAEAHLRDVSNLRTQGMALLSDVLAVQTRQAEVRLQQVEAEHALRLARLTLNYRMGLPLDTDVRPSSSVEVEPLAESIETLVERARQHRPELGAMTYEVQALDAGVAAARAGWLPEVALAGAYAYARPNPYVFPQEDTFTSTWEAGATLSMDLWNWGRTRAQTRQAQARADRAREQRDDLAEAVRLEVMQSALAVEQAVVAVEVAEQGLATAGEAYRVMRERVRLGAVLTADVLDAEVAYRNAEVRHAEALADYAVARAALQRAIGVSGAP